MEAFRKLTVVAFVLAVVLGNEVMVSYSQTICNMPASSLMACMPSVTGTKPSPPSEPCCSALSHADLKCLCSYKNSKLLPSLGINPKLAMQLPAKCKLPQPKTC